MPPKSKLQRTAPSAQGQPAQPERSLLASIKNRGGFVCMYPTLLPVCVGDHDACRFLSYVVHWDDYRRNPKNAHHDPEGWNFHTIEEIEKALGFKRHKQNRLRKHLGKSGLNLIEERRQGNDPPLMYFRANRSVLIKRLGLSKPSESIHSEVSDLASSNSVGSASGGQLEVSDLASSYKEQRDVQRVRSKTPSGDRPSALQDQPQDLSQKEGLSLCPSPRKKKESSAKERKVDPGDVARALEIFCEQAGIDTGLYVLTSCRRKVIEARCIERIALHADKDDPVTHMRRDVSCAIRGFVNDDYSRKQIGLDIDYVFGTTEKFDKCLAKWTAQRRAEQEAEESEEDKKRYAN